MYHNEAGASPKAMRPAMGREARQRVPRTVFLIGTVSLLTDISSEMVASVLPLYLFMVLRLSPLEVGWIDGLFNGAAALVRVAFAQWADRTQRHKGVALLGYGLSALARAGMFIAGLGGWISVAAILLLDRIGKGIRTAPRDAMIAASSRPEALGASFGVHRAMDAVGALVGPLLATGLLLLLPDRFDAVFAVSLLFACAGLFVLGRFVHVPRGVVVPGDVGPAASPAPLTESTGPDVSAHARGPTPVAASPAAPAAGPGPSRVHAPWRSPAYLALCVCCTLLAVFTVSDALVYAGLQRGGHVSAAAMPMLFVAAAAVFMVAALPVGRLVDRVGPLPVFAVGHLGLASLYGLLGFEQLLPAGAAVALAVLLIGLHAAATDGVVMAFLAARLPAEYRTTGMAIVTSAIGLARMGASVLFGWCWNEWSHEAAMAVFASGLLVSLGLAALVLRWVPLSSLKPLETPQ